MTQIEKITAEVVLKYGKQLITDSFPIVFSVAHVGSHRFDEMPKAKKIEGIFEYMNTVYMLTITFEVKQITNNGMMGMGAAKVQYVFSDINIISCVKLF